MEIVKLTADQKTAYSKFVAAHPSGSFLQAWEWGDWQIAQNKIVSRYLFMDGNDTVGSAQIIFMRTPLGNYFYCPYGPIWRKGLKNEEIRKSLQELANVLKRDQKVFFMRIEPTLNLDLKSFGAIKAESVQPPQTLIKTISTSEEELLNSFHQKTRYNIRVAQKHNVEIKSFKVVNEHVIDLIMQTSDRQGYRNHSRDYIKRLWEFFSNQDNQEAEIKITGYLATKDATPIASGLMVDFANTRMYLFGGSSYEYRNLMAPYLMHWQAILDAKSTGLELYDFGASENASGKSGGYMRFKMGFNPDVVNFSGTHDFVFKRTQYTIYKSLRRVNRLALHLPFTK